MVMISNLAILEPTCAGWMILWCWLRFSCCLVAVSRAAVALIFVAMRNLGCAPL